MFDAINRVSQQIEMFNVHYITKLDEKFVAIMQMMSTLDANVKQLQERSQSWDIFSHHMTAWSEHMRSSDQKMEILRKSIDILPLIENQLQNTDFKVQHIFEKTDTINEKMHEMTKTILNMQKMSLKRQGGNKVSQQPQQQQQKPTRNLSQEDFEQTEVLLRLSKIQRILQNSCSAIRLDREFENANNRGDEMENSEIKAILTQINGNLEKFPLKEIKQSFNLNKKHDKALEALTTTINHIDERTVRIFDTNSYQYKKILSTYKSTEGEILEFTNNANILLKKVEKTVKTVDQKAPSHSDGEKCNSTITDNEMTADSDEVEDDIIDQKGKCCIIFFLSTLSLVYLFLAIFQLVIFTSIFYSSLLLKNVRHLKKKFQI